MIVVSDTSPIINLAVIGQLNLLPQLYEKVVIPHVVYDEIVSGGAGQAGSAEVANAEWIEVKRITNLPLLALLESELDSGEAEAIVLAIDLEADLLLIDERKGRIAAERLKIKFIGLLGILIRAKHEGLIPEISPLLADLRTKAGFWIGDDLYRRVLQSAGES